MSEQEREGNGRDFLGKWGATVITTVSGVLLGWLILNPVETAQQEQTDASTDRAGIHSELDDLKLRMSRVEEGLGNARKDPYTGTKAADAEKLNKERNDNTRREIQDLTGRVERLESLRMQ